MKLTSPTLLCTAAIVLAIGSSNLFAAKRVVEQPSLTDAGQALAAGYTKQLESLRAELTGKLPKAGANSSSISKFMSSDALDAKLTKFVVLHDATPQGLAAFAQQSQASAALVDKLLASPALMKQMLLADGPSGAKYGRAMEIYRTIQKTSDKSQKGVLQRLAMAISLEHAVPIQQTNPTALTNAPATVDPVNRYLHFEEALLGGELDPAFDQLKTWELRFVVDGDEPDDTLAWGRQMLRNFRPDHIYNPNSGWRYVSLVSTDVKYGSENVKFDRPELQKYQNIVLNGGVCGRRAFVGRFILRSFGIPTIARPSRGHGALAHWTADGWVVNLGGGWGCGWTKTLYKNDVDFLATTQARSNAPAFVEVKRAQWAGAVAGEKATYGQSDASHAFWNGVAMKKQQAIIDEGNVVTLAALGEDLGEANEPTVAEAVLASPVTAQDKQNDYGTDGVITIPAAAYTKPTGNTREIIAMKSFDGGLQIFLPRFFPQGLTVLRGGTWKRDADTCASGSRLLSGGYGKYDNWGFRAAMTAPAGAAKPEMKIDLGGGVTMEMVYIEPGTFVMGGESTTDGRFECVEVPKHEVTLTRGFYLGKYEVTQSQYEAIKGTNPSRSTKNPNCPVDNVGEGDALDFCGKLAEKSGLDVRLPTEAEWEYAARAGTDTKWFFGKDGSKIEEYAWVKGNSGGKSNPVGQKKSNAWGLYDMYGNVCERVADKYARNYYSISPKQDPTGPSQGTKSRFEYVVTAPEAGDYTLSAKVVTTQYDQLLNVAVGDDAGVTLKMPFTIGMWQDSEPVTLHLEKGENTLRFWRDQPPQFGMAVKQFTLTPVK